MSVTAPGGAPAILLTRLWPETVIERLRRRYRVVVDPRDLPLSAADLSDALARFDAVCPTVTDRLDAAMLAAANRRTGILANYGAGTEHIDLAAAHAAGIVVTNTPDVLTDATAELAIALMLMAGRRTSAGERQLRAGQWSGWHPTHLPGAQLKGKVLGLVGLGRIGQAVARIARDGFGMDILYHGPRPVAGLSGGLAAAAYCASLDAMLPRVDFLSFHCPGGVATRHVLDRRRIGLLQPSAVVVNTARGSVIDETALAEALRTGRIAAAGLDVFEREPKVTEALLTLDNVTLLPHLGSATHETRIAMGMRAADNLDAHFDGLDPPDRVA
jgi:lactate dehydrogenase-like 2-hydroxyacid dehydrogenase